MPVVTPLISSDLLGNVSISFIGRFIRRTNLDELPQLFNILIGDMSFVGPRPSLPDQDQLIFLRTCSGVLSLRPGLTGLAQVDSFNGMSTKQKVDKDITYLQTLSFGTDLRILYLTFFYLLKPPPIY